MKRIFLLSLSILFGLNTIFSQTTIITHGYANGTSDPIHTWMLDMANAITNRAGGGVVRIYNKTTGNFDYENGTGTRTVLLFDWWDDSNDLHKGFSEAAGDALFAALMKGKLHNDFNLNDLHFIGHSRGCIVNSEAIERLLVAGIPVEQETSLDAHDWGEMGITLTDYDVNPDSISSGIEGWSGIGWADSYWQDAFFSTDGRAVEGTYSVYKGTITHDSIHGWYYRTIVDTSLHEGYYFSHLGGGSAYRPPRTGYQRSPFFNFSNDGIYNGNFERGGGLYHSIPGWWYHGGGGDADINSAYLVLHSGGALKVHDRFYIPPDAGFISFYYKIETNDNSGSIPNIDRMLVLINSDTLANNIWMDMQMPIWGQDFINVSDYQNSVVTMEFSLVDKLGGINNLNSEVWIDSVRFEMLSTLLPSNDINSTVCNVFPNPATDNISIETAQKSSIEILSVEGKILKKISTVNYNTTINISELTKGMYFVKVNTDKTSPTGRQGIVVKKFIKL